MSKWAQPDEKFEEPDNAKHKQIHAKALEAFVEVAELFASDAWKSKDAKEWKYEGAHKTNGDSVYTRTMHKNKAFVITGEIQATLDQVEKITFTDIEDTPKWSSAVTDYKRLATIGSHTDVVYGVSAAAVGGLISPRDVITARVKRRTDTYFMQGGQSVDMESMPEQKGKVRANDLPFVMSFTVIPDKPGFLKFDWMSNTDIKGWIPAKVVHQFFSDTMYQYMVQLREVVASQ